MVDLEWYRSFVHVHRLGTVSSAARGLNLTQPAVSQHLAALEATLGYRLFTRTPRRMVPTEQGKELYNGIAASIEQLESVTSAPSKRLDRVRLGAPYEFFSSQVVERLSVLEGVSVSVSLGASPSLLDRVKNQELDAAISTIKRPDPELTYRGLFEETFWLVGPPDVHVPPRRALEAWLGEQAWIAYDPELPIVRRFWRQVFGRRLHVSLRLTAPDLRAVLRAVECGMGVSVLPDYLCTDAVSSGRVTLILAPKDPVTNDLWFVIARRNAHAAHVRALYAALHTSTADNDDDRDGGAR